MKLAYYKWHQDKHVGFYLNGRLYSLTLITDGAAEHGVSAFTDMLEFLQQGDEALRWARTIEYAVSQGEERWNGSSCDPGEATYLPPITRPEKIICIGRNYAEHANETGSELPKEPLFFTKFASALAGADSPIILPRVSEQVDFEAELAVVIGREGKYIPEDRALNYVGGYMVFNDVSARDWQFRTGQFTTGKTFDTFASCGPFLVTSDEVEDPQNLSIQLQLNGETMQNSNTRHMIFGVARLISYLSQLFPLRHGDIISTGTPAGVGFARKPQVFLKDGDSIRIEIERVGVLATQVQAER